MQSCKRAPIYAAILSVLLCATVSTALAQSFTVTASPGDLTIHPGDQNVPLTINVSSSNYTGPISIALTGLPSGITTLPLSLLAGGSGTLMLNASRSADQEDFPVNFSPNTHTTAVTVIAAAGEIQATTTLNLTVSLSNPSFTPKAGEIDLPIVRIDTNGVPIATPDYVPGTITITSADGQQTYLPSADNSNNQANFHVHGNTTAWMPKLSYKIKLDKGADLLHDMGLDCPYGSSPSKQTCDKSKSYLLLANYADKTLLRDWAASALANAIPIGNGYLDSPPDSPTPSGTDVLMPWAPHSLFVELFLNNAYQGTYQLIEQVKLDDHRVNIHELSESDTAPEDVTGGYLLEIDQHADEAFVFTTPQNLPIGLKDPDFSPDPQVPEQTSYISNYVNQAENALFSPNFTDLQTGWRAYFDEASAVNFYIVNDVMGNQDGGDFYSSVYLYKDKGNPLLYMGPIWDFDISSGNVDYSPIQNPSVPWMQTESPWYAQWFKDTGFKQDVATQFNTLKNNGVFTDWLHSISQEAAKIEQSQQNNFKRWPMLGIRVWPNPQAAGSYSGEVDYLITYLKLRIAYLDSVLNSKAATQTKIKLSSSSIQSGAPITLTANVTGGTSPSGTVTFQLSGNWLSNGAPTITAALDGTGTATISPTNLPSGYYGIQAIYSGDDQNGLSVSPASYLMVHTPLVQSTTTITGNASSADYGATVLLTTSVIGSSGNEIPTGSIIFSANGQQLGTAVLDAAGSTSFSTDSLPSGENSIEASYSGDDNFLPSSSPNFSVTVGPPPPPPGFALELAPPSATIKAGSTATYTLTVSPLYGFQESVSFSCSGLPAEFLCSFSPSATEANGSPTTVSLAITTPAGSSRKASEVNSLPNRGAGSGSWASVTGGIVLALLIWPFGRRRKLPWAATMIIVILGMTLLGCGSSQEEITPAEDYAVTITASGGNITQTAEVLLRVTHE